MTAHEPHQTTLLARSRFAAGHWPPGLLAAVVIGLGLSIGTPNPGLAVAAIATLAVGGRLLWRPGEAPVLLLVFGIAWLGASTAVLQSNWIGIDIAQFSNMPSNVSTATLLSLCGVLAMAIGMRIAAPITRNNDAVSAAHRLAVTIPIEIWFRIYVIAILAAFAVKAITAVAPGLNQIIIGLGQMRWAFFFVLAYRTFSAPHTSKALFVTAFLIELAQGIGGFFSDFKFVFLVSIAAIAAASPRLSAKSASALAVLAFGLMFLGAVWTAVKGEYRTFISGGTSEQVVLVNYEARMRELLSRSLELTGDDLSGGFYAMFRRISYVEFFGIVLNVVPNARPHAEGEILLDALSRPLMPRILFPEKAVINDTDRTNDYTGGWAGDQPGTSISIGYLGEFYIDFGVVGMLLTALALGGLYGFVYRWLVYSSSVSPLLGMGMATAVLLQFATLDNSFTKAFGGLVAGLIAVWLVARFAVPQFWPWLARVPRRNARGAGPA